MTNGLPLIFWFGFGVLLLAPLIALWRNVEALAMICAESATQGRAKRSILRPLFEKLLKGSAFIAIVVWLAALVPYRVFPLWGFAALAVAFVALAAVFWRQLIRLHSRFEIELRNQLAESPFPEGKPQLAGWPKRNGQRKMNLAEWTIKENTQAVARLISELPLRQSFACTIVSIERQGVPIPNPGADTVLYPNDKVLLLGRDADLRRAECWLNTEAETAAAKSEEPKLSDLSLEHLSAGRLVPRWQTVGRSRAEFLFGVQIVGIERDHRPVLSPGRSETLQSGDQLLVLGTPEQVNEMASWLST